MSVWDSGEEYSESPNLANKIMEICDAITSGNGLLW